MILKGKLTACFAVNFVLVYTVYFLPACSQMLATGAYANDGALSAGSVQFCFIDSMFVTYSTSMVHRLYASIMMATPLSVVRSASLLLSFLFFCWIAVRPSLDELGQTRRV